MDRTFAAAEAALKTGKSEEAIEVLLDLLGQGDGPIWSYRALAVHYFQKKQWEEMGRWTREGVKRFPKDFDLWNMHGVAMRRQRRYPEALSALDKAGKLNPKNRAVLVNQLNIYNDMSDGPRAVEVGLRLVRQEPRVAEHHRMIAIAYRNMGELEKAIARLDTASRLQPTLVDAWMDRASILSGLQRHDEAIRVLEQGAAANPGNVRLLEAVPVLMRRAGRSPDARAYLEKLIAEDDNLAWAHYQLARTIADSERPLANIHFKRAVELAPNEANYRLSQADSLERSRHGNEGENIQDAYDTLRDFLSKGGQVPKSHVNVGRQIFLRTGDYEGVDSFGTFAEVGRDWARGGVHTAFLQHIGRVKTPEDRIELIEQHRMWGDIALSHAQRNPIVKPTTPPPGNKIRLGFLSSDLRNHPVAYFAAPVFEFIDRERFEVFCYSFYLGKPDKTQEAIATQVTAFRWVQSISDRDAAQMVADDQLDILFELGGSTHMNKLEVLAYKPAPLQASWLGYPHSAGLTTIDYLLVDPYVNPPNPDMLVETPLVMPKTWISLGTQAFRETDIVNPQTPEEGNGFVTFGTANNPHKYGPEMLELWAKVLMAVPNSQFLFIRPEGGTRTFRENMQKHFAAQGVDPSRVRFQAVRGAHLQFYNEVDIALDTFPLTGGTTTCETLWMGVPVVSLLGEAFFERLSYSILSNAGLGDLVARTKDDYIAIAANLAADRGRRGFLRSALRDQLKASPLGQRKAFAEDFYNLVAETVKQRLGKPA